MTHPGTIPEDLGSSSQPPSEAVTWLQARMEGSGAERVVRNLRRARTVARVVAIVVLAIGVAALALGLLAWGSSTAGIVVVAVLSVPGVVGPVMVWRRVGAVVRAVSHPEQVATQARDLVGQLRASPELDELAARLGGLRRDDGPVREVGRLRKGIKVAHLGSQVIGQAQPDRSRHPQLVPFTPERLGSLWRWVPVTLWGAPLSGFLAFAALISLLAQQA